MGAAPQAGPLPLHTGVRSASAKPRPEHPSLPAPSTGVSPEESPAGPRTYTDSRLSPAAPLRGTPVPQGPTPPHRGSSRPRHLGSSLPGRAGRVPSGLLWREPQRKWLLSLPSHPHTSFSFGRLLPPPAVLPLPRSLWSCLRHHLRHHVLSQASPRGGKRPATVTGRRPPFLSHSAHAAGAASVQAPCCSPGVLGRAEHPPSLTRGEGCAAAPDTVSDNRKRATRGIGTKEAGSRGALRKGAGSERAGSRRATRS